ncbi:HTTM domain-containing protein [Mycobacterium antarcticum]|uniref:HTTM domain-containing protein n=1 Tax=Mycolicibacterium sp. TUM20984 TaxID=3023368 RepID=UPI002384397D|nr:HTTM domain-containing protein [Mycolicibacterium sp. TUM20984]GLP83128.1 hypothetical protein TUM20984_45480 [Mycolicibacterium sp. TUM20984]
MSNSSGDDPGRLLREDPDADSDLSGRGDPSLTGLEATGHPALPVTGADRVAGGDGPASDRSARDLDATLLFGLFALLLAFSLILHQIWWNGFEVRSPHFVVMVAALWVALRPTSVVRFLVMIAAEVVAVALDLPYVGDHTLLVLITGACVIGYVGWTTLATRRLPRAGPLFAGIAPFLRAQLVVVYAFAALAKMNTAFLDGHISCAAVMSRQVAWFDPTLMDGSWRITPAIWGTVLIEAALPVLLAVPRTRVLGLLVGLSFHIVLALAGNVPFSALALALYVAFVPGDAPARLRARFAEHPSLDRWMRHVRRWSASPVALALSVSCWLAGAAIFARRPAAGGALMPTSMRLFMVLLLVAAGVLLILSRIGGEHTLRDPSRRSRLGQPVLALGILLLVVNGLSPYLGFKTESTFTMFSNLRTEGGYWNHLFIPASVRVFGYQDQLVRITGSNDPALEARTRDGSRLVRFELDRYLRSHPDTRATYLVGTSTGEKSETTTSPAPASFWTSALEKVTRFEDVRPPRLGGC